MTQYVDIQYIRNAIGITGTKESCKGCKYNEPEGFACNTYKAPSFAYVCEVLDDAPTVDAEPVRPGKWIPCAKSGLILTEQMRKEGIRWYGFKCSVCGFIRKGNAPRDANYCECCGARMVKDE